MSLSLIAVFIPILLMGGIVGRLFHEFAATLSAAILISLILSLSTTPMMCARLLRPSGEKHPGRLFSGANAFYRAAQRLPCKLDWALRHSLLMMLVLAATVGLNIYLYTIIPKGFFPQQDTGPHHGQHPGRRQEHLLSGDAAKLVNYVELVRADPGGGKRHGLYRAADSAIRPTCLSP